MKDSEKISCMWVGGPLTSIAYLSLSSAVANGYKPTIYLYDESILVPQGVAKKYAGDIVSENRVFTRENRYTNFSDLFRYSLLKSTDEIWFDLDCIFLDDKFPFDKEYIFAWESPDPIVASCVLKYPKDSRLAEMLLTRCEEIVPRLLRGEIQGASWPIIGPELLTTCVAECGLLDHVMPGETVFPFSWRKEDLLYFVDPNLADTAFDKIKENNCSFLHVWASSLHNKSVMDEKEQLLRFPEGSLLERLYSQYVLRPT